MKEGKMIEGIVPRICIFCEVEFSKFITKEQKWMGQ